jgi:hypothetical protein
MIINDVTVSTNDISDIYSKGCLLPATGSRNAVMMPETVQHAVADIRRYEGKAGAAPAQNGGEK